MSRRESLVGGEVVAEDVAEQAEKKRKQDEQRAAARAKRKRGGSGHGKATTAKAGTQGSEKEAERAQLTESSAVHANASSAESGGGCCQHLRDALLQVGLTGAAASAGRGRSISPRGAAAWPSRGGKASQAAEKFIW
eukprot:COSAG06_NODE_8561_length_2129_cov_20.194581_3_plen_137_part_00